MKKVQLQKMVAILTGAFTLSLTGLQAQEEASESKISTDAGMDIYSSYVWRGTKFGTGAAFQPWVELSSGNFTLGSWGSVNTGGDEAFEMDLYASYSFDFGLTLGVTDYYFGGNYLGDQFDNIASTHSIEPSISFEKENFSLMGAYMMGDGFQDTYIEAAYSFDIFDVALGAGNGQYTKDGKFNICNLTVSKSKEIKLSESFSLPLTGAVTLNPYNENFYIYVGISF